MDAIMASLRTMFDSDAAGGFDAVIELRLDGDVFRAEIAERALELARGG